MAISKVILNGVTQMDITDTTATAEDVANGKVFYMASGLRTVGTASCGLTDDVKTALLNCFEHVAWIDDQGLTYYDELYNALHDGLDSISAVYTQTGTVYTTDSLDILRSDLVVTATYGDGTTRTVTAYTLSGTLAVGTSTVTVDYFSTTATFTVTVTDSAYITAVFTQPQTTIYTDDSLDSLKSYLVVTYYSAPGATGTVLTDSAYTLSGTLTEGSSTVFVSYSGLTTSFVVDDVVDFYNISEWNYPGNLIKVQAGAVSLGSSPNYVPAFSKQNPTSISRNTVAVERGLSGMDSIHWIINNDAGPSSGYYLIPIPDGCNVVTFECDPSSYYASIRVWHYDGNNSWTRKLETGWQTGSYTYNFSTSLTEGDTDYYASVNIKFNSSGSSGADVNGFSMTFGRSDN